MNSVQPASIQRTKMRVQWLVHGMVLTALLALGGRWQRENALLDAIVARHSSHAGSSKEAVALMQAVHELMWPRKVLYSPRDEDPRLEPTPIGGLLFDTSDHLNTAIGACGSFATVTVRTLERAGYQTRMAQLLCGQGVCHVILEVRLPGGWAVMDPLFGLTFEAPDGHLASAAEVSSDWDYYRSQVPTRSGELYYPVDEYNYSQVQYTNWGKVPILLPLVRRTLRLFMGDAVDTLSLRTYVLNRNKVFFFSLLFGYAAALALTWRWKRRKPGAPRWLPFRQLQDRLNKGASSA